MILFHHRNPTSTVNVKRAAHPFSTKKYFGDTQYVLVHNGHISNYKDLNKEHAKLGITYQSLLKDKTYNDSEALAWDFALTMEGKQEKMTAKGAIAFICIKLYKGEVDKMYFGRNINPLKMLRNEEGIILSSEGEGELIKADTLYTFNYKLRRLTQRPFDIPTYTYSGGYNRSDYEWSSRWEDWDSHHRTAGKAGDWLPDRLRKTVAPYIGATVHDMTNGFNNPHADIPTLGTKHPIGFYNDPKYRDLFDDIDRVLTEDEIEEEMEVFSPTVDEIEERAMDYMIGAHGHYEQAYQAAEFDYQDNQEVDDITVGTLREGLLLEGVMCYIMDDPDYENQDSVNPMWEELWQKTAA